MGTIRTYQDVADSHVSGQRRPCGDLAKQQPRKSWQTGSWEIAQLARDARGRNGSFLAKLSQCQSFLEDFYSSSADVSEILPVWCDGTVSARFATGSSF